MKLDKLPNTAMSFINDLFNDGDVFVKQNGEDLVLHFPDANVTKTARDVVDWVEKNDVPDVFLNGYSDIIMCTSKHVDHPQFFNHWCRMGLYDAMAFNYKNVESSLKDKVKPKRLEDETHKTLVENFKREFMV